MAVISTSFGIEFELTVSARTAAILQNMSDEDKKNVRLPACLHHREDAMILYGFLDDKEKELFIELNKIIGVGSKQALRILSGVGIDEFYHILDKEDVKTLARVPGLGPKTARKIILALRDKLVSVKDDEKQKQQEKKSKYQDVLDSLVDMGFDKEEVINNIKQIEKSSAERFAQMDKREAEDYIFAEVFKNISKNA